MADLEAQIAADEREDRRALDAEERLDNPHTFEGWADLGVQARWSEVPEKRR
ncbi:hypothetical protein [Serinicoccus sp. CNJ-927]|uniref:hypothetical protein n=1 Tax=Serinicoccus sp. CNJ-927 TaxID=1904970 RepID=UPI001300D3A8|nr:hypothetical protein [Serinicoccus sp. CNJ-927]